jgi:predicted dehydrogenase
MGKVHALGYRNAPLLFGSDRGVAEIALIVDENEARLKEIAPALGNPRIATDWHAAVNDPEIDLIDICLPDFLHFDVAKAAMENGKHVYCEKPLCDTSAQSAELAQLARERGVITKVGHNFPKNPAHKVARDILKSGELGDVKLFRASLQVDVLSSPSAPFMWRCDGDLAPTGAIGDMASHAFSMIDYLLGDIVELIADCGVVTKMRPYKKGFNYGEDSAGGDSGQMREVTNPDYLHLMFTLANGARGILDVSRVATGRRFLQNYDIYGTKGGLSFDYDQVNRLKFFSSSDDRGRQGFRAIDVGPEVDTYAAFSPLANLSIGYNEFKSIEVAEVVQSVTSGQASWPTFADGDRIMRLVDCCLKSSSERRWVRVAELERLPTRLAG